MGKKLFVSNLDFEVSNDDLKGMFDEIGPVVSAVIAVDRETKRSKGFAFIEMESEEDAQKAIEALNNKLINKRPMKVVEDRGKTDRPTGATADGVKKQEQLPPIQRTVIFKRRKRLDPFLQDPNRVIDYKDVALLSKYLSERGKILGRKFTGLNAYNQRKVSKAIKRAQGLGLIPYTTISSR